MTVLLWPVFLPTSVLLAPQSQLSHHLSVRVRLLFLKCLEDIGPFCEALIPLFCTSGDVFPGFSKPWGIPCMLSHLCDSQNHLWCDTCWLYGGGGVSVVAKPFWSTYLQTYPQALVEVRGSNPRLSVRRAGGCTIRPLRLRLHSMTVLLCPIFLSTSVLLAPQSQLSHHLSVRVRLGNCYN